MSLFHLLTKRTKTKTDFVLAELGCIINSWRFYIPKFVLVFFLLALCTDTLHKVSPSLKVHSWLRMEPNASSLDKEASSATRRSTYTIICFSWSRRDTLANHSQNKHRHVEKAAFPTGRRAPYNSRLTPNTCALKWRWAGGMQTQTCSRCFETCGQKVELRPDRRSDLQVCLISWAVSVTSVSAADVFQTFCSRTSFSAIFLSRSRNAVKELQPGINHT